MRRIGMHSPLLIGWLRAPSTLRPNFAPVRLKFDFGAGIGISHLAICGSSPQSVLYLTAQRVATTIAIAMPVATRSRVSEAVLSDEPRCKVANKKT